MEDEIEKPQNSYHFQGFRDFLKYYKSRLLQQNGHCNRDRDRHHHLNRSRSSVLPHNVNDKANSDNNKKKINNYSCFRSTVLMNGPKKKRAQSDVPPNFPTFEDFLANPKAKASLGRSRSSINNSLKSQEWGKTPENSRAPSIHRTFSTGTISRANSFKKDTNNNKNGAFVVNRSTSMNIISRSRTRSNSNMASFGSFDKSRNGHVIILSNSAGVLKPSAMEMELECTLEELCYGSVKNIRVSRDVYTSTGQIIQEEETLTVNVKPGWMAGTKITFEGTTNNDGEYKADVIFVVSEKPHHLFLRKNEDLEMEMTIPLVDALTGFSLTIPLLGGEILSMTILDDVVYPGFRKLIVGQGMPNPSNKLRRGDLKVKFLVDFPKSLSEEQRFDVFSTFNGVDFSN